MIARIERSELKGTVTAEPSKSVVHRLLISAALSDGVSRIENVAYSEDILATIDCLRALGAEIEECMPDAGKGRATLEIRPMDLFADCEALLPCRESGSTLRFMIPLCLLSGGMKRLEGSAALLRRPLSVYEDLFETKGISFKKGEDYIEICGRLSAGTFETDAGVSSQFISGLLFALPLLEGESILKLKPPVESRSYIDMTMDALSKFSVKSEYLGDDTIIIPGGQSYKAGDLAAEGDWSNAAFFIAMGTRVEGLDENSLQPDKICREYFSALDAGPAELDISGCPDLGPVLMAYASMRHGCVLTGTDRLRIKESDRGAAMSEELAKFGVKTEIGENYIKTGCGIKTPPGALNGHNDHRIVMSLAVLASKTGGVIAGAEAVNKSYPSFFERFAGAGGICEILRDQG